MCELDTSWNVVTTFLLDNDRFSEIDTYCCHAFPEPIVSSVKVLLDEDMIDVLHEWLIEEVREKIGKEISPKFWSKFHLPIAGNEVITGFSDTFSTLYSSITAFILWFQKLQCIQTFLRFSKADPIKAEEDFISEVNAFLKGIVFYETNANYKQAFSSYLKQSLGAFDTCYHGTRNILENSSLSNDCANCGMQDGECICEMIFEKLKIFLKQLKHLNILENIVAEPITQFIHEKIVSHVEAQCMSDFQKYYIDSLNYWLQNNVVKWLDEVFECVFGSNNTMIRLLPSHVKRLKFYTGEVYGRLRIGQLFNIIIDFPESLPVLQDLLLCLGMAPELKSFLVKSLKEALQARLLHPGVNTGDILTAYISTMRALRVLDESGVLLENVGEPVKQYLRGRDDTVRCIVSSLTEDSNNELAEELNKGRLLADNDSDDETYNYYNWEYWEPDPVEAEPLKPSQASRCFDIISMLINIYGSKGLFIEEYRSLLADRILTQLSYDTEREIRHLELLKLRFGESQLHQCEVMLKDVTDSRRINAQIAENASSTEEADVIPINAMILSAQFWPPRLRDENVKLPDCLIESMEYYRKSFELLKGNRTLNWKPHLGLADLEIELNGKIHNFSVSPVHAAIIWHFQLKHRYSLDELSSLLQMPTQALHRKISFWQSQGLLREESNDVYVLVDEMRNLPQDTLSIEEDCTESVLVSAQDQKEEEVQVIWSYVAGMLTNLESLPLERIHAMLKMFAMQGPGSQCSLIELKSILEAKIKELKLVYSNGVYRLNSN